MSVNPIGFVEKLKYTLNNGFNNTKKLVNFIGENYKGNEKYFEIQV